MTTRLSTPKSTSPRRSSARTRTRSVAALVTGLALVGGLAACGDGADDTASDPAASSTPSPESPSDSGAVPEPGSGAQETLPATGSAGVTEVALLSATEGGGSASTLAFALDTDQAVADFAGQFEGGFVDTVSTAAGAQESPGATAYGATVAIGCEAPRDVAIDAGEAGFEVVPRLPESTIECLAPVTYVVLFTVPDA